MNINYKENMNDANVTRKTQSKWTKRDPDTLLLLLFRLESRFLKRLYANRSKRWAAQFVQCDLVWLGLSCQGSDW